MTFQHALEDEASVAQAIRAALYLAQDMGFEKLACNLMATAISEMATNVLKYANTGTIRIRPTRNRRGIEVLVEDHGPGIVNIKQAMHDGFSSQKTSLGLGLGVAQRAMDTFRLTSKPGKGTRVVMRKYLPLAPERYDYGVVSVPDAHFVVNGDAYVAQTMEGNKVLLAVIDGLGQGLPAHQAASCVKAIVEDHATTPLDILMRRCDRALRALPEETGVALSLLRITPRTLSYAGVGDTFCHVWGDRSYHLPNQNGIVGLFRLPTVRVTKYTYRDANLLVVLCTDGVHDHFTRSMLPAEASAWGLADLIMRNHRRAYGDATVLVAKIAQL